MPFLKENQKKIKLDKVIGYLKNQSDDNEWCNKVNNLTVDYVQHLGDVFGENWYEGILTYEDFLNICLPEHDHLGESKEILFPDNTKILEAVRMIKILAREGSKSCLDHVDYLKNKISTEGFTSKLVLVVINGDLKHVDGLHRILALGLLIDEGYKYPEINVYLCDNNRGS